MFSWFRKLLGNRSGDLIRSLIFFVLFYMCLLYVVDLRLIYHGGGFVFNHLPFFRGESFFYHFISYPGGPVEYLCAFLYQLFYIGWAGALVVTLQAWLISVCTGNILKRVNAVRLCGIRYIPPILLLIPYLQYEHYFEITTALMLALIFVCLYLRLSPKDRLSSVVVFLVLSVILYYLVGGAFLYFVFCCAIYELLFRHQGQMVAVFLLSAVVIGYVGGVLIFEVSLPNAFLKLLLPDIYRKLLAHSGKLQDWWQELGLVKSVYALFLLAPLTVVGWAVVRMFPGKERKKPQIQKTFLRYISGPIFKWTVESAVLVLLLGFSTFFFHDDICKTLLKVDYYAHRRMWPEVLEAARCYPNNTHVIHAVNHALYHTGRLGDDMFSYPQAVDRLLMSPFMRPKYASTHWRRFDVFLELGMTNLSEFDLTKSMDTFQEHPVILQRLALVNMVKGNQGSARVYLGALSNTLFHADWADKYLGLLRTDPNMSMDSEIQQWRSVRVQNDRSFMALKEADYLGELLEENGENKMAFEYLMAWYLLNGQLDKFAQNLDRWKVYDYYRMPQHYQEAILIYASQSQEEINLKDYMISEESFKRFEDINRLMMQYSYNKANLAQALAENYGNTYFYYFLCLRSGLNQ